MAPSSGLTRKLVEQTSFRDPRHGHAFARTSYVAGRCAVCKKVLWGPFSAIKADLYC